MPCSGAPRPGSRGSSCFAVLWLLTVQRTDGLLRCPRCSVTRNVGVRRLLHSIGVVCFTLAAGRLGHAASIPPREEQGESCGPDGVHQRFQTYYTPVKTKRSSSAYRTVEFNIILNISSVFRTVGLVGSLCCGIYLQVLAQRWKMYRF